MGVLVVGATLVLFAGHALGLCVQHEDPQLVSPTPPPGTPVPTGNESPAPLPKPPPPPDDRPPMSAEKSASLTVGNSPPEGRVEVRPGSPAPGQTLTCRVRSARDLERDLVTSTYAWTVDGEPAHSGPTLLGDRTTEGAAIQCIATLSDGFSEVKKSSEIVHVAVSPRLTGAQIKGENITTTKLTCDTEMPSPPDRLWKWTVNDMRVGEDVSLAPDHFERGDTVRCELTPYRKHGGQRLFGPPVSDSVEIRNAAPTVRVRISENSLPGESIRCVATPKDPDGDDVRVEWTWYLRDELVDNADGELTDPDTKAGDHVRCSAQPFDTDPGIPVTATTVVWHEDKPAAEGQCLREKGALGFRPLGVRVAVHVHGPPEPIRIVTVKPALAEQPGWVRLGNVHRTTADLSGMALRVRTGGDKLGRILHVFDAETRLRPGDTLIVGDPGVAGATPWTGEAPGGTAVLTLYRGEREVDSVAWGQLARWLPGPTHGAPTQGQVLMDQGLMSEGMRRRFGFVDAVHPGDLPDGTSPWLDKPVGMSIHYNQRNQTVGVHRRSCGPFKPGRVRAARRYLDRWRPDLQQLWPALAETWETVGVDLDADSSRGFDGITVKIEGAPQEPGTCNVYKNAPFPHLSLCGGLTTDLVAHEATHLLWGAFQGGSYATSIPKTHEAHAIHESIADQVAARVECELHPEIHCDQLSLFPSRGARAIPDVPSCEGQNPGRARDLINPRDCHDPERLADWRDAGPAESCDEQSHHNNGIMNRAIARAMALDPDRTSTFLKGRVRFNTPGVDRNRMVAVCDEMVRGGSEKLLEICSDMVQEADIPSTAIPCEETRAGGVVQADL